MLPRRRPAQRWRESGPGCWMKRENLSLRCGDRLGRPGRARKEEPRGVDTPRGRVPMRGTGADRLVVAMRPGNAGGAKGAGCLGWRAGQPPCGRSR